MDQIVARGRPAPAIETVDLGAAPRRGRRRLMVGVLVIAAIGAAAWVWSQLTTSAPGPTFVTQPAEVTDITVAVTATGTLQPLVQVDVSSELSGVVRGVSVAENQRVSKGDILLTLDPARLTAQVERAQANVQAAAARVREAQTTLVETNLTLTRTTSLSSRGMVADQVLETATAARDRAESGVATAEANLAIAEAELKLQQSDLAKTTIHAPIDGVVLTRDVDPGQTVASSLQAPVLFVIAANLENMQLEAAIDEADIGSVRTEQGARFTVDAFPDRTFDATIQDIAYAAVTTEGVVTYEAKLSVGNEELLLRPGMTATVSIVTREAKGVLSVPNEAFRFRPPAAEERRGFSLQNLFMPRMGRNRPVAQRQAADGSRTIHVLENGVLKPARVKTGVTDGTRTEILSGLEAGAEVVTGLRPQRR